MRYRRTDIVERAVDILDAFGLADLSMRRIASELGLQPSALYHHFANKQELLAAVADELLTRGTRELVDASWDEQVITLSHELRDAMLAYRDGAELIATMHAFGLGERRPVRRISEVIVAAGYEEAFGHVAAMTVLHFVFGHVSDEQTHLQAGSTGAIDTDPLGRANAGSFDLGLSLILQGIRHHASAEEREIVR